MEDYKALVSDVLCYLNDSERAHSPIFASPEEMQWLQASASISVPPMSATSAPSVPEKPDESPIDSKQRLMKEALKKVAPSLLLMEETPTVILIACERDEETLDVLKTLAKAITGQGSTAKIISALRFEQENRWGAFFQAPPPRLIVASDGFKQLPGLMRFYRKQPELLGKSPLLPLLPAPFYKKIHEKADLWKRLYPILKS